MSGRLKIGGSDKLWTFYDFKIIKYCEESGGGDNKNTQTVRCVVISKLMK